MRQQQCPSIVLRPMLAVLISTVFLCWNNASVLAAASSNNDRQPPPDFLDESSVVLITGAAGFLGSELAMALHRVYNPKKIIAIDSMDDGFSQTEKRNAEDLGLFEFKRQRLFHVLQTLGSRCRFYRVDFRPNIPDFQDRGEVPVLDHIFSSNPDITHVVHLADPYRVPSLLEETEEEISLNTQAVPRKKEQIKSGMMEALLEALYKAGKVHPEGRVPHFTYASSSHVYNHYDLRENSPNPPPFDEARPITSPSSLHGASKLLDEILAKSYSETHNIYSVGLRFFDVYGPWGSPGTLLFDLAERANMGSSFLTESEERILEEATRDYVYIDDAVDALMAAMQFRPSSSSGTKSVQPVVINVGSGEGTTLRNIVQEIQKVLPNALLSSQRPPVQEDGVSKVKHSVSMASTIRAKELLGFQPRITLERGLLQLLAWHHDRSSPYGSSSLSATLPQHPLEYYGLAACSPYDTECLKGMPIFPCASECSRQYQCTPSFYDKVLATTREWTAPCEAVLYTVNLDNELQAIPSATAVVSTTSQSHVVSKEGHCNLAFVSSTSPLVQNLQNQKADAEDGAVLKHGFWTLVLVDVEGSRKDNYLEFLPKISPGHFFGGKKTKRIIYCDPDVIIDSIPVLLAEASMQPLFQPPKRGDQPNKEDSGSSKNQSREGATAMLIGKGRHSQSSHKGHTPIQEAVQDTAYRTVRISIIDQMTGEGFAQPLDSSFIVHTLQSEDSRLFRCDVFGELIQWDVGSDQSAFEFILELHDMWSTVVVKQAGLEPWWAGEKVVTIPELFTSSAAGLPSATKRRLLDKANGADAGNVGAQENMVAAVQGDRNDANAAPVKDGAAAALAEEGGAANSRAQLVKVNGQQDSDGAEYRMESDRMAKNDAVSLRADTVDTTDRQQQRQGNPNIDSATTKKVDANFGGDDHVADAQGEGDGAEVLAARAKEDKDDDTLVDDDSTEQEDADIPSRPEFEARAKDVSAYDTWMGVLSATSVQYFVRVVPSSEAGVVVLNDYEM